MDVVMTKVCVCIKTICKESEPGKPIRAVLLELSQCVRHAYISVVIYCCSVAGVRCRLAEGRTSSWDFLRCTACESSHLASPAAWGGGHQSMWEGRGRGQRSRRTLSQACNSSWRGAGPVICWCQSTRPKLLWKQLNPLITDFNKRFSRITSTRVLLMLLDLTTAIHFSAR